MSDANFIIRARDKSKDAFDKLDHRLHGLSKTMKMSLGGLGGALSAAAMIQYGRSVMNTADHIDNLSQRMQLGIESVQSMEVMLNETGLSAETFEMTMVKLIQTLDLAKSGNERALDSFKALGITYDDLASMTPERALEAVTKAMYQNKNSADVNVAATEILGARAGKLQSILLNLGKEGFGELNKRMKDSAQIMSEDVVKAADKMEEDLSRAARRMKTSTAEFLTSGAVGWRANYAAVRAFIKGEDVSDAMAEAYANATGMEGPGELITPEVKEAIFNPDLVDPQNAIDRARRIAQLNDSIEEMEGAKTKGGGTKFGSMRDIYKDAQNTMEEKKKARLEEERNKLLKEIRDELKELETGVQVGE